MPWCSTRTIGRPAASGQDHVAAHGLLLLPGAIGHWPARQLALCQMLEGSDQGFDLGFVFFQQAKPGADQAAGRSIAPGLHLRVYEASDMLAKGNGCGLGRGTLRPGAPTKTWYWSNPGVNPHHPRDGVLGA